MAINFDIKSVMEWEDTINMLNDTYNTMEFAAEQLKKVVQQCLLENGIRGDLVPVLMDKYEEDVLASVKTFQAGLDALIKSHRQVLENSQELDRSLNNRMAGGNSSTNYGGGR